MSLFTIFQFKCQLTESQLPISRPMKFLRFHRGIGPVIINLSRLYVDLLSMAFVFMFITIAWTFGLVYILNNKEWIDYDNRNSNEV